MNPGPRVASRLVFCCFAVAASLACGLSCNLGPAPAHPREPGSRVARVVPQSDVAGGQFFRILPGGRFALFSIGAIDLWNLKVAWVERWTPARVATAHETIAIEAQHTLGIRLFNLLDGSSLEFAGREVPHFKVSEELVPLQREHQLTLLDTVQAREIMTLAVPGRALSVISCEGTLVALSESGTTAESPVRTLSIHRFEGASGQLLDRREVEIDYGRLVLPPSEDSRSSPFLTCDRPCDRQSGLRVGFVSGCLACRTAGTSELTWYRRYLDEDWTVSSVSRYDPYLREHGPSGFLPSPPSQLPARLREQLSTMTVASIGSLQRGLRGGDRFITGDAERECVWSLHAGARFGCTRSSGTASPEPAQDPIQAGCELQVGSLDHATFPGAFPITCGATVIATAYDLGLSEWALGLPDGRFAGSAHATKYLAFYRADGSLLEDTEVARLRTTSSEISRAMFDSLGTQPTTRHR